MMRLNGWNEPAEGHRGSRHQPGVIDLISLSSRASLEPLAPSISDQGRLGSCTGHAVSCAIALRLRFQYKATFWTPEPLDLYLGGRTLEGTQDRDAGATLADVLRHAEQNGFASGEFWGGVDFRGPPPKAFEDERPKTRLVNREPLDWDIDTIRWEISCGFPVVFGIRLYPQFDRVGSDGVIAMPDGPSVGRHAMCILGYDDDRRAFRVQNSWGSSHGDAGRLWIPYDYIMNPFWCGEIHSVRVVRAAP